MGIILQPFAWLLLKFYEVFQSYGIALILFAVVVKLILFPVTLKTKKSMIQTTMLSGKMQQLQKQYGKDRERYNLEVQKLYEKEKINPMGGCLWSLIPMVVLIALYGIIREPLTYFMHLSMEEIQTLAVQLDWETVAVEAKWMTADAMEKAKGVFQNGAYNQLYLLSLVTPENLSGLQAALGEAGSNLFVFDFSFLGLDLSRIPNWKFWAGGIKWSTFGLFLLPMLSTVVSWLSMKVTMATNQVNQKSANNQVDSTNKMMMWMMPLMSLWIGFTVPAGLSIYWISQYFVTMVQEVICGKMLKKDYEAARQAAEEQARREKEEEKRRKEEARIERARRIEEEKKNRGKKKSGQKKHDEPDQEGVNKEDSREGIRAYARGRAYIPDRFGGVTPYQDPDERLWAKSEQAVAKFQEEKEKEKADQEAESAETAETAALNGQTAQEETCAQQTAPADEADQQTAPAAEETQETEEVEVEVEQVEVEVDDQDDHKEGV